MNVNVKFRLGAAMRLPALSNITMLTVVSSVFMIGHIF